MKKTTIAKDFGFNVKSVHRLLAMPREDVAAKKTGLGAPDAPRPR